MKHLMLSGNKRSSCSIAAPWQGDSSREQQEVTENILPPAKMSRVSSCTLQPAEPSQTTQAPLLLQASTMPSSSGQQQIRKKQLLLELLLLMRTVNAYSRSIEQSASLDNVLQAANASLTAGARAMQLASELFAADSTTCAADTAINVAEAALAATFSKIQLARHMAVQVLVQQQRQQQQVDEDLEDTGCSSCCTTVALPFY